MNRNNDKLRERMVIEQLKDRGIESARVLDAFKKVPREDFVPHNIKELAFTDRPLSIGRGQTISQPYIVALMTENILPLKGKKVLEIGTGSGYQAAILAYLGAEVYTIERHSELAKEAENKLKSLGLSVRFKVSDGSMGWKEESPFSRIIMTAASLKVPPPLLEQLGVGGKIVAPVGSSFSQNLRKITKVEKDKFCSQNICGCVFVPLVGKHGLF